ncbi:MAG: Crp/Fnr family transcriptional regulator [Pseudomonadota bacterium]
MISTQLSDNYQGVPPSSLQAIPLGAGRRCSGILWSNLKEVCDLLHIPCAVSAPDRELLFQHVQYKTGQRIHTIGQEFDTFCIVNSGFLKTVSIDEFGNEQVLSFPMKGDILGVDSIHTRHYSSETVALSDCNLILFPFKKFSALSHSHVEFEHAIYGVMSRELMHKQAMVSMLGAPNAEARVARFLISLSERFAEIGYSKTMFSLRMTRQEIGSYLGLSLETVSRTLSALNDIGLISVDQRAIKIIDYDMLKSLRRIPPSRSRAKLNVSNKTQTTASWPQAANPALVN